jgi:hypothetical protein
MKDENKNKDKNSEDDVKEDFCPPCMAAVPLAFAVTGASASEVMDGTSEKGKNFKNILFYVSIAFAVVAVLFFISPTILAMLGKKCTSCEPTKKV